VRKIFCLLLLLTSPSTFAGEIWFSNKVEVGYDEYFIASKASFGVNGLEKVYLTPGIKFRLDDILKLEPSWGVQIDQRDAWMPRSFFKLKLEGKF